MDTGDLDLETLRALSACGNLAEHHRSGATVYFASVAEVSAYARQLRRLADALSILVDDLGTHAALATARSEAAE